jgi:hypothetical protein
VNEPGPPPAQADHADPAQTDATAPSDEFDGDEVEEPGQPPPGSGEDEDFATQATVINNFFAGVAANTVGVSGSSAQTMRTAIPQESGVLAVAEVRDALRYYLRPAEFDRALDILTHRHLVVLTGPEGSGKKAGTLELARGACPNAESYTVLPPTRSLRELALYRGYRADQAYLLHDWVPVAADSGSVAGYDLEQLTARLSQKNAYMAMTFENAGQLQVILREMCVAWSPPDPAALLDRRTAELRELRLSDTEHEQLRARARQLRSPRLVLRLAESATQGVETALAEAGENENSAIASWFEAMPARWKVWAVTALTFLSGVGERRFEVQLATLTKFRIASSAPASSSSPDDRRDEPGDDDPFPQSRWKLANDASLEAFISERDPASPVGSEHRPAFRTKAYRLHFMMELNRRFGDDLWTPVREWLFTLADQPFGEAQVAAGYGLALLARCAFQDVEATYLTPWAAGDLKHRLMAVNVLWSMAEDELVAAAALRLAVGWVRNRGQERAITAALAFGGPLGQRYPSEGMRWLWILAHRGERIGRIARIAISQLFAVESEADREKSAVARFLVKKVRAVLKSGANLRERRAALAVVNSVLGTTESLSEVPAVVRVLRTRPADFQPVGELWAAVLNSMPHRYEAITSLHLTLAALTDGPESIQLAAQLGRVILPRLTPRSQHVLEQVLPDPERARRISASVIAAFLGTQRQAMGTAR